MKMLSQSPTSVNTSNKWILDFHSSYCVGAGRAQYVCFMESEGIILLSREAACEIIGSGIMKIHAFEEKVAPTGCFISIRHHYMYIIIEISCKSL